MTYDNGFSKKASTLKYILLTSVRKNRSVPFSSMLPAVIIKILHIVTRFFIVNKQLVFNPFNFYMLTIRVLKKTHNESKSNIHLDAYFHWLLPNMQFPLTAPTRTPAYFLFFSQCYPGNFQVLLRWHTLKLTAA